MALENYRPIQFPEKTEIDNTDVVLIDSSTNGTNKYQLSRLTAQAQTEAQALVDAETVAREQDVDDLKADLGQLSDVVIQTAKVELQATELDGYYNTTIWNSDQYRSTKKADVSGLDKVHIEVKTAKNYNIYTFTNDQDTVLSYLRADASDVSIASDYDVPENAKYVYVSTNTKAKGENTHIYKYTSTSKIGQVSDRVDNIDGYIGNEITLVKNGHALQFRSKLEKTNKYIALNCTDNGSQNGGFNFSNYHILNALPDSPAVIAEGTLYKGAADDICPVRYNGSYRGANHGKSPTYKITASSHGKTTADIGSVWKSNNNHNYVIYRIDSENEFSIVGDIDDSRNNVEIAQPSSPLTHVSGATNTDSVAFTNATSIQMLPTFKGYQLSIINENGSAINADGAYIGNHYFQINEKYELFDITDLVTKLKNNAGSNTNESYYSDSIDADMLIQNSYRFFSNGACVVACTAIPLKQGVYVEYWGGVQSGKIGNDIYAPFTEYDSIQTMGSSAINLIPTTWDDADFPAYKMYQFDTNNGFAVGYCIDYGEGLPSERKDTINGGNGAGFWYGSSKKMYPHFYDYALSDAPDLYGSALSFYSFRAPVIKSDNTAVVWYEIGDAVYVELELFAQKNMLITLPEKYAGRKLSVVKKSDTVSFLTDIVSAGGVYVTSSGAGSATIKLT